MKAGEKCRAACARLRSDPSPGVQDGRGGSQPPGTQACTTPRAPGLCPATTPSGRLPGRPPPDASSSEPGTPGLPVSVPAEEPHCAGQGLLGTAWQAIHYPLGGHETPSPTFRALPKRNQDPCLRPWTPRPWLRSLGRRGVRETWVSKRSQPAPEVRRRRVRAGSPQPTQPWSADPTRTRLEDHAAVAPRVSPLWGGEGGAGVRVRFPPRQGHGEQFPTLPRICKKKKRKSLHVSGRRFCLCSFEGWDTKQNFLPKNAAAHTVL